MAAGKSIRISRPCLTCGKTVTVTEHIASLGLGKFCSMPCYRKSRKKVDVDRFWAKVRKTDGCWFWTGHRRPAGYGQFPLTHSRCIGAHRYSWQLVNGEIPKGMFVMHKCDNPPCVNPEHLQLGTSQENTQDKVNKNRQASGEKHGMSCLTKQQVISIIDEYKLVKSSRKLASKYRVDKATILRIIKGVSWRCLSKHL